MSIGSTNGPVNAGNSHSVRQFARTSLLTPDPAPASVPVSQEIKQVCEPTSLSLEADSARSSAGPVTDDAVTRASLSAILQTLQMNNDLATLIGA